VEAAGVEPTLAHTATKVCRDLPMFTEYPFFNALLIASQKLDLELGLIRNLGSN
jgi:hypothetical protein